MMSVSDKISDKTTLRRVVRQARKSLSSRQRRAATRRANRWLYRAIRRGKRVGVYWAVGSELNLHDVIAEAQRRGALVYLPYIEKGQQRLWFTPYPTRNTPHRSGRLPQRGVPAIPQFGGQKIRAHALQTLIVPLLAVDQNGFRLGQGGGFYDVTLAHTRHRLQPKRIGVGFACQQVAEIPRERHDQALDAFVCERGWQYFAQQKVMQKQSLQMANYFSQKNAPEHARKNA